MQDLASVGLDRVLGIRTTPRSNDPDSPPSGLGWRPFGWFRTVRVFSRYPLRRDDVLVDVGSGAGRVVLLAAIRFRCRRIVGLERDPHLDRLARRNLDNVRPQLRSPVEFVQDDAASWHVPDDASVVFFNNVFMGDTFRALTLNILASVDRAPRRVTFLYGNPKAADLLLDYPRFVLIDEVRSWRPDPEWADSCSLNVYEIAPRKGR